MGSDMAPSALLGASVARYRGHDRTRGGIPSDWGSLAGAHPPDVSLVASGPGRHAGARQLCQLYAADPARGGAAAGNWPDVRGAQNRRGLPGDPQAAPSTVDVRAP